MTQGMWPQRHRRGSGIRVQSYFLLPIPGWATKSSHYSHHDYHCSTVTSWDFWGSALSISRRPSSATSRPGLYRHQSSKETTTHTSTTGNRTSSAVPRMYRRPVINITTIPLGWAACTGARRHSNTDNTRFAFSPKAPLRVCCHPYPPLESIKGEGKELSGHKTTEDEKTRHLPTSEINISSNTPLYSFFETWDRLPLLRLVTPTQALRCKEIQHSSFPAGRRTFFHPN
jgi:hypothetical protein